MDFLDRIKKEMSEGIVKAILEHHGYRVIDTGIEKTIREVSCLPQDLYLSLGFPDALRKLPDFVVMDKDQSKKYLVDVKYRFGWNNKMLFDEKIRSQLEIFESMTLVVVNGNPPEPTNKQKEHDPSEAYIRCVQLRMNKNVAQVYHRGNKWRDISIDMKFDWWSNHGLWEIFDKIQRKDPWGVIEKSVNSLAGIISK